MTESTASRRTESRRTRLWEMLDGLSNLRLCGPSDDPDEQTAVIEAYRYILINIKTLSKGLVPSDVLEQLDALVPGNIESIYDVYESKAHLDAIATDIVADLGNLTFSGSVAAAHEYLISPTLIEVLSKAKSVAFDLSKLTGYCREINSSFYHENVVACLLLMRTVLNHVPPVFGYPTFAQAVSNAGKSLRENLEYLDNGLRKLADLYAHQPIRSREQYPTKNQVEPFRPQFELLLQEVVNKVQ